MSVEAMKQALAAIETYSPEYMHGLPKKNYIKALRQAIAEAEKQPVHASDISQEPVDELEKFAELVRADEREAVLETVEALTGMEADRHKMFSEGYDYALYHIRQLVEGRSKK